MSTSIHDIKIQTIDFEWINQTTKLSHLKKAIRLIEQDGNYYTQLKDACYARMQQIDPSCKRIQFNNNIPEELKQTINSQLTEWEQEVQKKQSGKNIFETNLEDYEKYFDNETNLKDSKKKTELAQKQRVKGNQAIKSKDFDQAITYYTKSIELDAQMFQSYGNRALAYLKKKQFNKCIQDCDKALTISSNYSKAYHRKAKALIGLKKKTLAYRCYKQILKLQPENSEMNKEMMELREQMNAGEIAEIDSSLIPQSEFKKIAIEEDSEEEEIQQA